MKLVLSLEIETDLETLVEYGYVDKELVEKVVNKNYTEQDIEELREQIKDFVYQEYGFMYDINPKIVYSEIEELQEG